MEKADLAGEGAIGIEPSVAPRDHSEIDDGDEPTVEDLGQMVHYEIGTIRTQRLVVESHTHILCSIRLRWV